MRGGSEGGERGYGFTIKNYKYGGWANYICISRLQKLLRVPSVRLKTVVPYSIRLPLNRNLCSQ